MKFAETSTEYILNSILIIKLTAKYTDKVNSVTNTVKLCTDWYANARMYVLCGTIFFRASAQNGGSVCLFTFVLAFFTLAQCRIIFCRNYILHTCAKL